MWACEIFEARASGVQGYDRNVGGTKLALVT